MPQRLKTSETRRAARLGGREVRYVLRRTSRRRTIGLSVNHEGLTVSAPWSVSLADIHATLARSESWVLDKLDIWRELAPPERAWVSGERLNYLDGELELLVRVAMVGHGAWRDRTRLAVFVPSNDADCVRALVTGWYREQAARHLPARVAALAPRLAVRPRKVAVSDARTQWGSCTSNGAIRLNWRLMQARPEVIDYVVIHELAHLRHMDHSPAFWRAVAAACPDHERLRAELRDKDACYRAI